MRLTGINSINATGNSGNNTLSGNSTDNIIDGLSGNDTIDYAFNTSSISINLAFAGRQYISGGGYDTILNIENIIGSNFNDTLLGNSGSNTLNGGIGNDYLDGSLGNDILFGGADNDIIEGGLGADTAVFNINMSEVNLCAPLKVWRNHC